MSLTSQTQPLLNDYMTKAQAAGDLATSATALPDLLTQTLKEKLADSPIVAERSAAATQALTDIGNAPTSVMPDATGGVVLNPVQQEALINSRRSLALQPLIQSNQRYDLMTGNISDIVGQAGRALTGQAQQANTSASIAKDLYSTTLDSLYKEAQLSLEQQKAAALNANQQKLIDSIGDFKLAKAKGQAVLDALAKSTKGVGTGAGIEGWLQGLFGGELSADLQVTEPLISQYNTKLFEIAGKSFTGPEKDVLNGLKLNVKDGPETIRSKIEQANQMLDQQMAVALTGQLVPTGTGNTGANDTYSYIQ